MNHRLGIDKGGHVGHNYLDVATVRPMRGMVLVKPSERKPMSDGGIILPDSMKDKKAEHGIIVRLGAPMKVHKRGYYVAWTSGLAIGDTVYYSWTAGTEVKTAQGIYLMLLHNELIAVQHND